MASFRPQILQVQRQMHSTLEPQIAQITKNYVQGHLHIGVRLLREHRTYLETLGGDFDPEVFLRQSAQYAGKLLGCELAVSFEVIEL